MQRPASLVRPRRQRAAASWLLAPCILLAGCDTKRPAAAPPAALHEEPSATRSDLAERHFIAGDYPQALALAVSALAANPENQRARSLAAGILITADWQFPETTLPHRMPVDHLHFAPPSTLWVSLRGEKNTTVRWNLDALRIESALFPTNAGKTRGLVFNSTREWLVVQRAGVTLLCNARSLLPVRDIGPLPRSLTPSSAIAFSPDGLLIAHPTFEGSDQSAMVWHLRDTKTGEIIRSSEPAKPSDPPPLAAFLDRQALRVLRQDGSLWTMPVSPVSPVELTPPAAQTRLLHARFAENGSAALVLRDRGPHLTPAVETLRLAPGDDSSLAPAKLRESEPWTRLPCLWTGLYRGTPLAPKTGENAITFPFIKHTFRSTSPFTAAAFADQRSFLADRNGDVTLWRGVSIKSRSTSQQAARADAAVLTALENLCQALAGGSYDASQRKFIAATTDQRLAAVENCDFQALGAFLPELDFAPAIAALKDCKPAAPPPDALAVLTERLARATDTSGQPDLVQAFETADHEAVLKAIKAAGPKGPTAAKALELALASTRPEWIDACLQQAADLPPLLRRLALSRIAWLQDRKADAIAGWPEVFPDLKQVRLREDWDGWEGADFSLALEILRLCVSEQLGALVVPENSTPEQRQAVIARLNDPLTLKAVGRARFARACLKAALALSAFKEHSEATLKLAATARQLGEAAAPCLRAEAMALTALGDYQNARERWVSLITDHPLADQLPGDYAEAAYTSFENADPRQAMAILTTGMHRFPDDANFALRAGWVSLLTGNAERAYRFLLAGRQIGYPPEKLENATALLAIAAVQSGAAEDAAAFYQDLVRLDAAWENPQTIETLPWPDELKTALRQIIASN